jgi:hypothetical protein
MNLFEARALTTMPRFHFDVCENSVITPDDEGLDLLSIQAARLEAARAATEMMKDRAARKADPADVSIAVRDGSPESVCVVTVALKIAGDC